MNESKIFKCCGREVAFFVDHLRTYYSDPPQCFMCGREMKPVRRPGPAKRKNDGRQIAADHSRHLS